MTRYNYAAVEVEKFAKVIFNGQTQGQILSVKCGKTKNTWSVWNWERVDGWKLCYNFGKILSTAAAQALLDGGMQFFEGLSADWHTQRALTYEVSELLRKMKLEAQAQAAVMPFGKYKGMQVNEVTDLSYLTWLANSPYKEDNWEKGVDAWLKDAATKRCEELGALNIGGRLIDPKDTNRFAQNTVKLYNAIQAHEPIEYIAEQNDGRIWNAYNILLPCHSVGHPYYGVCVCLDIEGKAKRAKGYRITIYDYEVINDGRDIKVNGFCAVRA